MPVSPPHPRDLPLNALRAFEAAARLGGFVEAAHELGVSPGAVSAHIRTLEGLLGATLFRRSARGVVLTDAGLRSLPDLTAAFDALCNAMDVLRAETGDAVVHVATLPAIAQLWLSPRLSVLRRTLPDVTVSVTAMESPPNLKRQRYDLALFYDPGADGRLADDVIFPVCTPRIAAGLAVPEDLAGVACLSDASWSHDWTAWAAAAMPGRLFAPRGPVFSLYALAVAEAVAGAGVLIGHAALVADHLAKGTLVAPFPQAVTMPCGLRLWSDRPIPARGAAMRLAAALRAMRQHEISS